MLKLEAIEKDAQVGRAWAFDAPADAFKLGLEAWRIRLAHLFDPMMAVHTSNLEPLPHQITAVYESMLPRQPLRFVLADDPGAGKTIMAGLFIRELLMRADARRVLIVTPGSLCEQWQDELDEKFGVVFAIFTRELDQAARVNAFEENDLLIARLDQLSRSEDLQDELKSEIGTLTALEAQAKRVVHSGQDRKWEELSRLLQDHTLMRADDGTRRKLILFTEHRDTLNCLQERIQGLLGSPHAVVVIHGGINRDDRRKTQEAFRFDPAVLVLVATDAAGEGVNLQNANLMVNYDLPWNPNRLEQRFGRIHRIGQTEVCHLWNMVANQTREGDVFQRLFDKLEVERAALGGRVFDILGEAFDNLSLRDLLIEAIRYGERLEIKARLNQVIEGALDTDHLRAIMARNALVEQTMRIEDLYAVKEEMDKAEARRLQPYFIRAFFTEAFQAFGGELRPREPGRFEIRHVPAVIRTRDRVMGETRTPVLKGYERVCQEVRERRERQVDKTLAAVNERLVREISYWSDRYIKLSDALAAGKQPQVQPEMARRRVEELTARLEQRKRELANQRHVVSATPVVIGGALVIPQGLLDQRLGSAGVPPADAQARARIERIAMQAVIDAERALGHTVFDVSAEKCGWDLTARPPIRDGRLPADRHIEVKGRAKGADTVTISRNEILCGLNQADKFILAIVIVDGDSYEGPHYIRNPFRQEPDFGVASINYRLAELLANAQPPAPAG